MFRFSTTRGRWLLLGLCVILLPVLVYARKLQLFQASAAPPAPTILAAMDFEGSQCTDSEPGGQGARTCVRLNANADCGSGTSVCPGQGTLSGYLTSTSHRLYRLDLTARTSGVVTMDFMIAFGNTTSNDRVQFGIGPAVLDYDCAIAQDTGSLAQAISNDGTQGATITYTAATWYYGRLNYDIASDRCRLWLWTDAYNGTLLGTSEADGASGGNILGWQATRASNGSNNTIDDITYCDADLTTSGVCRIR